MPRPAPYQVEIANRQRTCRIDRREFTRLMRHVLTVEQVASAEISLAFVGDPEIHEINRTFLQHDFPTDVISFVLDSHRATAPSESQRTIRRGAGLSIEGEIIVSTDTAASNGQRLGTGTAYELRLYVVHGLLHLCGYDDLTPREKRLMRRREAEMLRTE
jgi:probable rRNA maturation factor